MQDEVPTQARGAAVSTVSRLALASFTLGMLAWPLSCLTEGLVGMLAVMFGMFALERIRLSAGRLRGKAFAWTGIGSGTASVLLVIGVSLVMQAAYQERTLQLDGHVRRSFTARSSDEARAALDGWKPMAGRTADADALQAFAESARSRYGAFEALLVSDETSESDLLGGQYRVTLHVEFEFAGGRRPGTVQFVLTRGIESIMPLLRVERIVVEDAEAPGGRIEFPPPEPRADASAARP